MENNKELKRVQLVDLTQW